MAGLLSGCLLCHLRDAASLGVLMLIALSCFHLQVGIDPATPVTGPEADVMLAAYYAAEVAAKTIKAGNTNTQVWGREH